MSKPQEKHTAEFVSWSDERLVKECLNGNPDAWAAILEKYQKLIYSVPIKYGLPRILQAISSSKFACSYCTHCQIYGSQRAWPHG